MIDSPPLERSVLPPRWIRDLVAVLWLVIIYGTARVDPHPADLRAWGAWGAAILLLVLSTLAIWGPAWRPVLLILLVAGLAAAGMELLAPTGPALVGAFAVLAMSGSRLPEQPGRISALTAGIAFLTASGIAHHPSAATVTSLAPGFFFTYLAAAGIRRLREEQGRTEALLHEVVASRDAQVRAAALDERARLAREIHDVLAHTLSALSVQLEGARMLLEQRPDDPAALTTVERAGKLARDGLDETRRAVNALRGDSLPGPDMLPQLCADFERDTGVRCRFQVEGEPVELSSEARLALYRTAQEALTNVRKHAEADKVDVRVRYTPAGVDLEVENSGRARDHEVKRLGGYGLVGMRERAELLGGCLDAGPTAAGFQVKVWVPL
ncbi:MAG: sensor histidine kinase [Chloroflexota bacterium]|nr:sensor histidine kinase [Chloroflexota bacterium]